MQSNKFLFLAITSLWLVGLYGALFALGYLAQCRRRFWWRAQSQWDTPRLMAPLYLSLSLFCVGLTIHLHRLSPTALASTPLASMLLSSSPGRWELTVGWTLLALLLMSQAVITAIAGLRFGWDESLLASAHRDPWDARQPGTPHLLVQWLAAAIWLWLVIFTFGNGLYQLWVMLMRMLGVG